MNIDNKITSIFVILMMFVVSIPVCFAGSSIYENDLSTALADYIAKPDSSYGFIERSSGHKWSFDYAAYLLTSQTWMGEEWKHQLHFYIPKYCKMKPSTQAVLVVAGKKWKTEYQFDSSIEKERKKLLNKSILYSTMANILCSPIAVVYQVPRRPILGLKKADSAMAYTFDQFLETGDLELPLLEPMVKSVVRAMDAAIAIFNDKFGLDIKNFTAIGGSKQGWAVWRAASVDDRVAVLVPIVIDIPNLIEQIRHYKEVWGTNSQKINAYAELGITERLDSKEGFGLLQIIDPYLHFEDLKSQTKLIITGTNDEYFPGDGHNAYWDDLKGPKYIRQFPNEGHKITSYKELINVINAVHQSVARGIPMPSLEWSFSHSENGFSLEIKSDITPYEIKVWRASSDTLDFRQSKWDSTKLCSKAKIFFFFQEKENCKRDTNRIDNFDFSRDECHAMLAEIRYKIEGLPAYSLTTTMRVGGSAQACSYSRSRGS